MKRVYLLALSFFAFAMTALAVPVKPGMWQTVKLKNGTELRVQRVGDEYGHWSQAADGTCYVEKDGFFEPVDEQSLIEKREARIAVRAARRAANEGKRRDIYASTSDGLGAYGTMSCGSVPSIGEYTIPVVMVQFADTKFKTTTTVELMKRYYNEEGYSDGGCIGSVRDYFKSQSGGQFIPTFDVVGIVTLSKNASYYGQNDDDGIDQHLDDLPGDAINAAIEQLGADFSQYVVDAADEKHAKGIPLLCMLYAGKGEATESESTANSKLIWPCEWGAEEDPHQGKYQNLQFNSFFVGNELNTGGSTLMGLGVFCHEFGHALGLPDFYCTDYSYSQDDSFGNWSIMDTGSYVDDYCRKPIGYNAYEKSYLGWLDLKEVGDAEEVVLQSPFGKAENSAYIIRHSGTETFIFENRQPGTWYPTAYGSGVLVTRIAYNKHDWEYDILNNVKAKRRARVLTANGDKLYYSASSANLYGGTYKTISTLPTFSGTSKTIGITDVKKNNDGTVTLTFGGTPTPTPTPEGVLFYESFDKCKGTGGNDGKWSGSVASTTFLADNVGWESPHAYGADKCARFGKSSVSGSAQLPSFQLNGKAVLTFKAGAWNATADGTNLSLYIDGGTTSKSSFTMVKGGFTDFTAELTATGDVQLTFVADKGRFFLDEVMVKNDNTTGIKTLHQENTVRVYTIDGRYVGSSLNSLPSGLYIVNGKKIVK